MTRHVFLSFVIEDEDRVNLFRGQAKNKRLDLAFDDYSVRTPYNSQDAGYIRSRITERLKAASVTICLVGPTTATSAWVDWELEKSYELGNRVFGVQLYGDRACPSPSALRTHNARVLAWDVDQIVRVIG